MEALKCMLMQYILYSTPTHTVCLIISILHHTPFLGRPDVHCQPTLQHSISPVPCELYCSYIIMDTNN